MPTALELKRKDWQRYKGLVSRSHELQTVTTDDKHERDKLLSCVRELAGILKRRFGVQKVVLFGSLASRQFFTADSDIDLGIEGVNLKEYWDVWKFAEEFIGDRRVDIIDLETAPESLKSVIKQFGVEL
jgi:predicted nucleotidyltransferase